MLLTKPSLTPKTAARTAPPWTSRWWNSGCAETLPVRRPAAARGRAEPASTIRQNEGTDRTVPAVEPRYRRTLAIVPIRYDVDRDALTRILADEPRYRVDQVWDGLYRQLASPADVTTLPRALRARLDDELPAALSSVTESIDRSGATVKWLFGLEGGAHIETVLMHYRERTTVCVSTQAGCAMACGFCATGQGGFERHLTTGEIVEQIVRAARRARDDGGRLGNVVFMGMGEPLANYDRVWPAVERAHGDLGLSARHLTLSTVGLVPGIRRLAREDLPVNLAVSLHAANDALRDELVPINRRYPLSVLAGACADYLRAKGRRLSFEWALIDGTNDRRTDARELADLARALPLPAHVNLIPLNPTPGYPTRGTPPDGVRRFRQWLQDLGVNATVRRNRGTDIDAACGQLAAPARDRSPAPPARAAVGAKGMSPAGGAGSMVELRPARVGSVTAPAR
jgi:23S rRNA (adenine2503-C2)-methyltransferase